MHTLHRTFLYSNLFILGTSYLCISKKATIKQITLHEYVAYSVKEQITYFKENQIRVINPEIEKIFKEVFHKKHMKTMIEALRYAARVKLLRYGELYRSMAWEKYDVHTKLQGMNVFEFVPVRKKDIPALLKFINDEDWLIREKMYQLFRKYKEERANKKYYKKILVQLKERNPQVLQEVIKTLQWYKGKNKEVFKKLYRRSFSYKMPLELIIIIKGLSKYKNRLTFRRLKKLASQHKSFLVREEAKKQLRNEN